MRAMVFQNLASDRRGPEVNQRSIRKVAWALSLAGLALLLLPVPRLVAQTAHFGGAIRTLGSGFTVPIAVEVDASGNVFVGDFGTGDGGGSVKEILAAGGYTTVNMLYNYLDLGGMAIDGNDNVFVTSSPGVYELLAAGGYSTANPVVADGFYLPTGVAVDGSGNVFFASTNEGVGNGGVYEVLAAGGYTTINLLAGGFYGPEGLALDGSGNVFVSDSGTNVVDEILAAGGYTTIKSLGSNFYDPYGLAVDGSGNVFVADSGNGSLKEMLAVDGSIPPSPTIKTLGDPGDGSEYPAGVAVDRFGNVFFADSVLGAVREISMTVGDFGSVNLGSSSSNPITIAFTFDTGGTLGSTLVLTKGAAGLDFTDNGMGTCKAATAYNAGDTCTVIVTFKPGSPGPRYGAAELLDGSGSPFAIGYVQGIGVGPQVNFLPAVQNTLHSGFNSAGGVAMDGHGNIFIADFGANAVYEVPAAGGYSTLLTLGSGFSAPVGVAVDGGGNVFVADFGNSAVKEILAQGGYTTVNTLAGEGTYLPTGVAVDGGGNVIVADFGNGAVKQILATGGYTTVNTLSSGFSSPFGVAVDGSGNVFVADSGNNAVKEVVAAGGYTTVNTLGSGFSNPRGVAVDTNENVYVADFGTGAVKEILAAGGYTTVTPLGGGFTSPFGVAVDGNGNVFVGDYGNNSVERLDYADAPSLNFATTFVGSVSKDSPQTVTLENVGNATLSAHSAYTFPADFQQVTGSGAPVDCKGFFNVFAGAACRLRIEFAPVAAGYPLSESLVLTDNSLNAGGPGYATQSIHLSGTGVGPPAPATLTSPASGSTLTGSTAVFSWTMGSQVTQYDLHAGTTGPGSSNIFVGVVTGMSKSVTGIPTTGGTLYVRLYSQISGTWQYIDYAFTEASPAAPATMTTPAPGSKLASSSATFTWTAGSQVTQYDMHVGTTGVGSSNIFLGLVTGQSKSLTGIPTTGGTLNVRLYSQIAGAWQYIDYTYTEASPAAPATMTTPAPGSKLTSSTATFTWTAGSQVTQYDLHVGTTGAGSSNVFAGTVTGQSKTVTGIPTTGGTLNVRLYSFIAGAWQSIDYTYTETGPPVPAAMTSPAPGSTLSGSTATFSWTTGTLVTQYDLHVGTAGVGSSNLFAGTVTGQSKSVTGIPTTSGTVYVRLYSLIGGMWQSLDYTYTEASPAVPAAMTSPSPGSTLAGSTVNFTWTAGTDVTQYDLHVGTTGAGSTNIFVGVVTGLSKSVTGIPTTGGTLYVRLYSLISGAWQYVDYTYTEQ